MTAKTFIQTESSKILTDPLFIEAVSKISAYDDKTSKAVDPATVAAIAGAVLKLIDLFGGGDEEELIEAIRDDIDYMISLIEEVVDILKEIEVVIKEGWVTFVKTELQSYINTVSDSHEIWELALNSSDTEFRSQTLNEITNVYTGLQVKARNAASYGYAHYDSIALAFVAEGHLCRLLAKPNIYLKDTLIPRYQNYFNLAISDVPDSLVSRQKSIVDYSKILETKFQPNTILISKTTEQRSRTEYFYDNFLKVEGDIVNGFSFSEYRVGTGSVTEPRGGPLRDNKSNDGATKNLILQNSTQIKQSYNDAHIYYIDTIIPSIKTLSASIESCNNYTKTLEDIKASFV